MPNQYFGAAGLIPNDLGEAVVSPNSYYGAAGIIPDDIVPTPPTPPTPTPAFGGLNGWSDIAIHIGTGVW